MKYEETKSINSEAKQACIFTLCCFYGYPLLSINHLLLLNALAERVLSLHVMQTWKKHNKPSAPFFLTLRTTMLKTIQYCNINLEFKLIHWLKGRFFAFIH